MLGSRQAKPSNTTSPIARFASRSLRSSAWPHKAENRCLHSTFCGDIETLKTNHNREMLSFRYASLANYSEGTSAHSCGRSETGRSVPHQGSRVCISCVAGDCSGRDQHDRCIQPDQRGADPVAAVRKRGAVGVYMDAGARQRRCAAGNWSLLFRCDRLAKSEQIVRSHHRPSALHAFAD